MKKIISFLLIFLCTVFCFAEVFPGSDKIVETFYKNGIYVKYIKIKIIFITSLKIQLQQFRLMRRKLFSSGMIMMQSVTMKTKRSSIFQNGILNLMKMEI